MRNWITGAMLFLVVLLVIAAGLFAVSPLLKLDFMLGKSHIMTGTNPSGWSQGLTRRPNPAAGHDTYCLIVAEFYWYVESRN